MKKNCKIVKSGTYNSAGQEQEIVVCYCGTPACTKNLIKSYPLPTDFLPQNNLCLEELTKEEERRFYEHTMKTTLI